MLGAKSEYIVKQKPILFKVRIVLFIETCSLQKNIPRNYEILSCLVSPSTRIDIQPTVHYHSFKKYTELKDAVVTMHERTKPEMFAKLIGNIQITGRLSTYLHELMATANKVLYVTN